MSIFFKNTLLKWHDPLERDLPWKTTNDPYKIWLSEVILQQTRVDQGRPYYLKFVENYPNVKSFSEAPLSDVLRLWQGLGYYARARNMHLAAKQVIDQFNGVFPTFYNDLLKIKVSADILPLQYLLFQLMNLELFWMETCLEF